VADWHRGFFSGGLVEGLVRCRTGTGSCSVEAWSRAFFSGELAQGFVQWVTGTGSCSVADWSGPFSVADC